MLLEEEIFPGSQPAAGGVKDEQEEFPWMRAAFPSRGSWQEVVPFRAVFYSPHIRVFSGYPGEWLRYSFLWDNEVSGHPSEISWQHKRCPFSSQTVRLGLSMPLPDEPPNLVFITVIQTLTNKQPSSAQLELRSPASSTPMQQHPHASPTAAFTPARPPGGRLEHACPTASCRALVCHRAGLLSGGTHLRWERKRRCAAALRDGAVGT